MTTDAGLAIASYGSYYRAGTGGLAFEWVLETALELRAPTIRVWAGDRGSDDADEAHWARVIGDSRRIAEMAGRNGVDIAFEFHVGTLTDTNSSAVRLLSGVCDPTVGSYWQPRFDCADEYRLEGLGHPPVALERARLYLVA